eukprot:s603_g26.t1
MALKNWCEARAVLHTRTAGDQPQSNGRAEQSVGEVKARIRRMLKAAEADFSRWPLAARCLHEKLRAEALGLKPSPPFLSKSWFENVSGGPKNSNPLKKKFFTWALAGSIMDTGLSDLMEPKCSQGW